MTTCAEVQESLSALADGEVPDAERAALEAHLADCPACLAERDALRDVHEQVRSLPRVAPPAFFPAQVMAAVVGAGDAADGQRAGASAGPAGPRTASAGPGTASAGPGAGAAAPSRSGSARLSPKGVALGVPVRPPGPGKPAAAGSQPASPDVGGFGGAASAPLSVASCGQRRDDLSAYADGALAAPDVAALTQHLLACAPCTEELRGVERVRERVRALPRVAAPDGLVARVLERLAEDDRRAELRAREALAARAAWWGRVSVLARAACVLLLAGAGAFATAPRWTSRAGPFQPAPGGPGGRPGPSAPVDVARADAPPPPPPEPAGPFDASWELRASGDAATARQAARAEIERHGRVDAEWTRDETATWGCVVTAPARAVDDLLDGLDRHPQLEARPEARASVPPITTDVDRVVLRSGFVLVGVAREEPQAVTLRSGADVTRVLSRGDVERVELASAPRRLRIVVRGGR